jgi:hypothetical protein
VNTEPPSNTEHITHVGLDGREVVPVDVVIEHLNQNTHKFYVVGGGQKVYVKIYRRAGSDFIRTESDATKKDNLLALKRCG